MTAPIRSTHRQLFVATESEAGVAETLVAGDYVRVTELSVTASNKATDREFAKSDDTENPPLIAGTTGEMTFSVELSGSTTGGTTPPPWGVLMRACGIRMDEIRWMAIGAVTVAPRFQHLELVTGTTSSATGLVYGTTNDGDAEIFFIVLTGTFVAEVFTGGTSGAVATTTGALSDARFGFSPASREESQFVTTAAPTTWAIGEEIYETATPTNRGIITDIIGTTTRYRPTAGYFSGGAVLQNGTTTFTMTATAAAQIHRTTATIGCYLDGERKTFRGCRGDVSIDFQHGDRGLLNFTMMGVLSADVAGINLLGVSAAVEIPPIFKGVGFTFTDGTDSYDPLFNSCTLAVSGGVVVREDANDATQGYDVAHIDKRRSTLAFNPDVPNKSVLDYSAAMYAATQCRADFTMGSVANNWFVFRMPYVNLTGLADGNRDGVYTHDVTASLTNGDTDEADCEFAIFIK